MEKSVFICVICGLRQVLLILLKQLRVDIIFTAAFRRIAGDVGERAFGLAIWAGGRRLGRLNKVFALRTSPFNYLWHNYFISDAALKVKQLFTANLPAGRQGHPRNNRDSAAAPQDTKNP